MSTVEDQKRASTGPVTRVRRTVRRRALPLIRDYLLITIGVILLALAIELFLAPHQVVTGGASGVAILLNNLLGTPIGPVILAVNVPLFFAGLRWLGGVSFALRTLYGILLLSIIIDQIRPFIHQFPDLERNLTVNDPLLYILYGGVLEGVGTGIVFRAKGSTGGSDIAARLLHRFTPLSVGNAFIILDASLFLIAGFYFGLEKVLYAMTVSFASSRMVDFIQEGMNYTRMAMIITSQPNEVAREVMSRTGHGVTIMPAKGAYSGAERPVLLVVVLPSEVSILTDIIHEADPAAFVIISQAQEVLGEGFRPLEQRK